MSLLKYVVELGVMKHKNIGAGVGHWGFEPDSLFHMIVAELCRSQLLFVPVPINLQFISTSNTYLKSTLNLSIDLSNIRSNNLGTLFMFRWCLLLIVGLPNQC